KRPQVRVVKEVVPANDGGTFELGINGTSYDNAGAGFGDGQGTVPVPGATGAPHSNRTYTFTANYGDVITCTFTNERKPSSIVVTKTPSPSMVDEPGGSVTYTVTV